MFEPRGLSQAQGVAGKQCSQRNRVSDRKKILSNTSLNKQLDTVSLILFVEMEDGYLTVRRDCCESPFQYPCECHSVAGNSLHHQMNHNFSLG